MNVSIIIVSYNTKEFVIDCIESVYKYTSEVKFEIIVVDNNSTDGTLGEIRRKFPEVVILESLQNLGFGKANNLGSKIAKGEFLFFLNSDTILLNNAVKMFYDFLNKNRSMNIHFVGCMLFDKLKKIIHSGGTFPSMLGIIESQVVRYLFGNIDNNKTDVITRKDDFIEVNYITGADLFVSSDIFSKLNGFDEDFFMYYEDTDLQKRAEYFGYSRVLIWGPEIFHLEGGSKDSSNYSIRRSLMVHKSMLTYFRKHSGKYRFFIFKIIFVVIRLPLIFDKRSSLIDRCIYFNGLIKS
jgi:GT2 family glycosyltransferase